jgi:molybdopterin-binding protein
VTGEPVGRARGTLEGARTLAETPLLKDALLWPRAPAGYVGAVPEYRVGQAAELMGVSPDTMRRWVDAGRVTSVQRDGRRYVDGADLARMAVEIAEEQVPDRAESAWRPPGRSARNHFLGLVTRVERDGVAAQVDIQAGPHRFVALITREAADDLDLEPGMVATAVVKATNVGVELPDRF